MNELTTQIPEQLLKFNAAKEQIKAIAEECKNIVINSKESLADAKNLAKDAKRIENLIEDKRKELTKPLLDEQRSIKSFADNLTSELNNALKGLRGQILAYEIEQERIRKEEQRKLDEERRRQEEELRRKAEELAKQLENDAEVDETELQVIKDDMQKLQDIKTEQFQVDADRSKSIRLIWDFELTDLSLVPREFLMLDEAKVKAAIKLEVRNIPGVRIFQKEQLNLR